MRLSLNSILGFIGRCSVLVAVLSIAACSFVDHRRDVSFGGAGKLVPSSVLEQIKPGKTSRAWLHANLGEPTSRSMSDDGEELLTYAFDTIKQKRLRILFVYQSRRTQTDSKHVYVSLKKGLVTRCWKDFSYAIDMAEDEASEDIR